MHLSTLCVLAAATLAASKPVDIADLITNSIAAIGLGPGPRSTPPALPGIPPTILIAPGAWHQPSVYQFLRGELGALGYPSDTVSLASVGSTDPNVGMLADAAAIRAKLTNLANQGQNIILVAHSYAGVPASTAVAGLTVKERTAAGKKGGVAGVLYVAAFVLPVQVSLADALNGVFPSWFNVTGQFMNPINPAQVFYNDVTDKAKVAYAVSQLKSETVKIASEKNTFAPWTNGIPVGYVYTSNDNAVPPSLQSGMTSSFPADAYKVTMATGHAPFLSQPKALAANIRDATVKFMAKKA